jgi:hypothetical protein
VPDRAVALTHHLVAALIDALAGAGTEASKLEAASDLQTFAGSSVISARVADLCRKVGEVPGADLDRLLAALAPDPDTIDRALGERLNRVRALVEGQRVLCWREALNELDAEGAYTGRLRRG